MKITLETAETIHKAMAYTVMICSYETTKKIPAAKDVKDMVDLIFPIYLKNELGATEIGD